jgi:hypothetical protein
MVLEIIPQILNSSIISTNVELQNRSSNLYHACKLSKTAPRTMY